MLDLFLEVLPITCFVGIVYAVLRYIQIRKNHSSVALGAEIMRFLFVCYITGLVNLVLVPQNMWTYFWFFVKNGYSGGELAPLFSGSFNFVPTVVKYLSGELTIGAWVRDMLTGNFLMFIPMGALLPFVTEKIKMRGMILLSLLIPLAIEIFQPVISRSFDVDDVIMNCIGIIFGLVIAITVKKIIYTLHNKGKNDYEH